MFQRELCTGEERRSVDVVRLRTVDMGDVEVLKIEAEQLKNAIKVRL